MAERGKKEMSLNNFFETTADFDSSDESEKNTETIEKAETSHALDKPGTSSGTDENIEVEYFPLVDNETGQMYKLYEVIMKKLGIEIPELKDENLSDSEKEMRRQKSHCLIIFEEKSKGCLRMTSKQIFEIYGILCCYLTRQMILIKTIKQLSSSSPRTIVSKVKFYSLEHKKAVLAKKNILNKTRFRIDHDLTPTEICVQAELLKIWKMQKSQKNLPSIIPDKIYIKNRWVTIQQVSQHSTKSK